MNLQKSRQFQIREVSQVGEARRAINVTARECGLSETLCAQVSIIVNELAHNIIKHAQGKGELVVRGLSEGPDFGIEVLAIDQGTGMSDITQCMKDGYSTAGSPGTGLGAVNRLSTVFDLYSRPALGSVIMSQVWNSHARASAGRSRLDVGAVCLPIRGETESGDAWEVQFDGQGFQAIVADGLGHGILAAKASDEAIRLFRTLRSTHPTELIQSIHQGLKRTRGAAVAIARLNREEKKITYGGAGNIAGAIVSGHGKDRRLASHNGTVGLQISRLQEFTYEWDESSALIMASDGVTTQWGMDRFPGLINRHPSVIVGMLYRDFKRGTDDVTVLVVKASDPQEPYKW